MALRTNQFYPVQGMKKVLRNLNRVIQKVEGRTKSGLVQGGLLVQRGAQEMVPVALGNLRSSAYTVWSKTITPEAFAEKIAAKQFMGTYHVIGKGHTAARLRIEYEQVLNEAKVTLDQAMRGGVFMVEIGFTAYYAIYVHEDATVHHEPGEYKFLIKSLEQNQNRIMQILVKRARIR